jgi:hypothetical protein
MPETQQVRVSVEDLRNGNAYIRWPLEAKLNLCHWGGAPWADRKPEAHLHALQCEVLARPERELIVHGASRLGKSVLGGCEILIGLHTLGAKVAVFAHRWDHVAHEFQYAYRGIRAIYKENLGAWTRLMYRNQGNNQAYEAEAIWGSKAKGASISADDGAAALGHEFTHIILGEGSHVTQWLRERVLQRAIDSALSNQKFHREDLGRLFIFTTPKQFAGCSAARVDNIRKDYGDLRALNYGKVPWKETCWVREASLAENPAFDASIMEAAKKNLDYAAYAEQYLGQMIFRSGRIFDEFEDEMLCLDPPAPAYDRMRLCLGIDTGAYFGAVLMGIDDNSHVWVLDEVYTEKKDIDISCELIRGKFTAYWNLVTGDKVDWPTLAAHIKYCYVDPASQHKTEIKNRLGLTIRHPIAEGAWEILPTIDMVKSKMRDGEFHITKRCTWLTDQIHKYIWKEVKQPHSDQTAIKEPRKIYDHLCDAMRIGAVPLMKMGPMPAAKVILTIEQARRQENHDMVFGELERDMERGRPRTMEDDLW